MAPLLELVLDIVSDAPEFLFDALPRKAQLGCLAVMAVVVIVAVVLWVNSG